MPALKKQTSSSQSATDKADLSTPMMQQYLQIKEEYPDCILFFRLGDFYEMFLEDAKTGAKILGITLTSRDGTIPMAGVPYHAVDQYLYKLIQDGYKVAICEQVSEPDGRKIVEREVVRVVTPGTLVDSKNLQQKQNNYLAAIVNHSTGSSKSRIGLAVVDVSTGEWQVTQFHQLQTLKDELTRLKPAECLVSPSDYNNPPQLRQLKQFGCYNITEVKNWEQITSQAENQLQEHFQVQSLRGFGLEAQPAAVQAAGVTLHYLEQTQKQHLRHLHSLQTYHPGEHLVLDSSTIHNLELFATLHEGSKQDSLYNQIDHTVTAMGGRLLNQWLRQPLRDQKSIEERLEVVNFFYEQPEVRSAFQQELETCADIERLLSRLSLGMGHPPALIQLQLSLEQAQQVKNKLQDLKKLRKSKKNASSASVVNDDQLELLQTINKELKPVAHQVAQLIAQTIDPEASTDLKSGGYILPGVDKQLDTFRSQMRDNSQWIKELEKSQRAKTKIPSLKIKSNKVFGYFIEVTHTHADKVPANYERKQTLVNSERYITSELKEHEQELLQAQEQANALEEKIFNQLVEKILTFLAELQATSRALAQLDCLLGLSELALQNNYCRPQINDQGKLYINQGRHPVVEQLLPTQTFVPNDAQLDNDKNQLQIITGPNMAGKSVYMRQVALIVLLAHLGSFVPASKAEISLVDRIFVRSGAADVITAGLSTFMVEMVETAYILRHATQNSLIIMDEIGRGTSTYDGISLAWSIATYLVTEPRVQAKTLFATHYHELQALAEEFPDKIKNLHMTIEEQNGEPIFLYTIAEGGASHSYGLEVAKLAGLPSEVVSSAKDILKDLKQRQKLDHIDVSRISPSWKHKLEQLTIEETTPLEALEFLKRLKERG